MKSPRFISVLPALLVLAAPTVAQSLLVPHYSQNGQPNVAAFSAADGTLQSAAFIELRAQAAPSIHPVQATFESGQWWVSDESLEEVHRWSAAGAEYAGLALSGRGEMLGATTAFGSSWYCWGNPGTANQGITRVTGGTTQDLSTTERPEGITEWNGGLVYTFTRGVMSLDSAGNEIGDLIRVFNQGGFGQPTVRSSTGNLLIARWAGNNDIVELDATGTIVQEYDVAATLGIGGLRAAQELQNGDFLVTTVDGIYRIDAAFTSAELLLGGITAGYVTEVPDVTLGTGYCSASTVPNSTGAIGRVGATGSALRNTDEFRLSAHDLPLSSFGYFLCSRSQGFAMNPGGSVGNLCLSGAVGRFDTLAQSTQTVGFFDIRVSLAHVPQPTGFVSVAAGETWNWQVWHRDSAGGIPVSNFTNAVSVPFL